jgi:hypothetical protein
MRRLSALAANTRTSQRDRRRHRQHRDGPDHRAVGHPTMIVTPRAFLRITDRIDASDVVMMPDLSATHARGEFFCAVRVHAGLVAIELAAVDPGQVEPAMQIVPSRSLISHQCRLRRKQETMKPSAALSDLKTASNVRPTTFDAITGAFDRIDIRGRAARR